MNIPKEIKDEYTSKRVCPLVNKGLENCYYIKTNSVYSFATIYYCIGNYEECEIYITSLQQKKDEMNNQIKPVFDDLEKVEIPP